MALREAIAWVAVAALTLAWAIERRHVGGRDVAPAVERGGRETDRAELTIAGLRAELAQREKDLERVSALVLGREMELWEERRDAKSGRGERVGQVPRPEYDHGESVGAKFSGEAGGPTGRE
jgi:hypothetical protein